MTMQRVSAIALVGIVALWSTASSQTVLAQANPGPQMGSPHGVSNNLGTGTGDIPGSSVGLRDVKTGGLKGAYGLDLSQRIAQAQSLVDEVNHGKVLTDRDTQHIRNLMREDFVAWNKRYDLVPSALRTERDHWLLEPSALSPNDWAQQRLKWLQAQRDWVLAHGG
jgi:hypothetical protein